MNENQAVPIVMNILDYLVTSFLKLQVKMGFYVFHYSTDNVVY